MDTQIHYYRYANMLDYSVPVVAPGFWTDDRTFSVLLPLLILNSTCIWLQGFYTGTMGFYYTGYVDQFDLRKN